MLKLNHGLLFAAAIGNMLSILSMEGGLTHIPGLDRLEYMALEIPIS